MGDGARHGPSAARDGDHSAGVHDDGSGAAAASPDGDAAEDGRHVQLDGRGGAEEVSRDGELRGVVVLVTLDFACDSGLDRVTRTRAAEFLSWVKARVQR